MLREYVCYYKMSVCWMEVKFGIDIQNFMGFTASYVILGLQIFIGILWGYKNL